MFAPVMFTWIYEWILLYVIHTHRFYKNTKVIFSGIRFALDHLNYYICKYVGFNWSYFPNKWFHCFFLILKTSTSQYKLNNKSINDNYYNWKISSGDYYRDYESTERYGKKLAMKRRIERFTKIFIYMGISFSILIFFISYILWFCATSLLRPANHYVS
jgi:hypothetical protein